MTSPKDGALKKCIRVIEIGSMGILMTLGCDAPAAAQQNTAAVPPKLTPVISINVLMVSFVDQAADAIWTAAANPPKHLCEWQQVEYRATQLATTGTLLRVGGSGPLDMQWRDAPEWAPFADKMTALAVKAAQAARDKNVIALKATGNELILNCEACHRAFKPEIPTQNINTHLSHALPMAEGLPHNCRSK
jgi:hypothetical protein